jgi:hypothetical protein
VRPVSGDAAGCRVVRSELFMAVDGGRRAGLKGERGGGCYYSFIMMCVVIRFRTLQTAHGLPGRPELLYLIENAVIQGG